RCWRRPGFWLSHMSPAWLNKDILPHSGSFADLGRFLPDRSSRTIFDRSWLPKLLSMFAEVLPSGKYRLKGSELSLAVGGSWAYCQACRTTQRPFPGKIRCINCGQDSATLIDPATDPVFSARKGYYRASTVEALKNPPIAPIALIAAEHTA